jgi:hypothetical protein
MNYAPTITARTVRVERKPAKARGRLRTLRTIVITVAATLLAVAVGLAVLGSLMPSASAASPAVKTVTVKSST